MNDLTWKDEDIEARDKTLERAEKQIAALTAKVAELRTEIFRPCSLEWVEKKKVLAILRGDG
jgi:hypothetical protein